jgi:hypothetical protein
MRYPRSGQEDAQLRGRVRRDERQVHQGPRVAGGEGEGAQERWGGGQRALQVPILPKVANIGNYKDL